MSSEPSFLKKIAKNSLLVIFFLFLALSFGFSIGFWGQAVEFFGIKFADDHMATGYTYAVIWAFLIAILLLAVPFDAKVHKEILWVWALRCFISLGFMLYYESFYTLDATIYYQHAKWLSPSNIPPMGHGTDTITWLASLVYHYLPLGNSYHTLKILWSFTGFLGCLLFYYSYVHYTGKHNKKLFWFLNAFPSILFWSSIFGKDPIVLLGLGLLVYGAIMSLKKPSFSSLLFITLGLFISSYIRMWLSFIFLAPYAVVFLLKKENSPALKLSLLAISGLVSTTVILPFIKNFNITGMSDLFSVINVLSNSWARGGSGQSVQAVSSMKDIFLFLPFGIFTSLFRPLIGEINNVFGLLSGVENSFLLLFTLNFIKDLKKEHLKNSVFLYLFFTIFIWSMFYSFISTQNLGTAVRFKLQVLPLMLLLPFIINSRKRIL